MLDAGCGRSPTEPLLNALPAHPLTGGNLPKLAESLTEPPTMIRFPAHAVLSTTLQDGIIHTVAGAER